MKAEKSIHHDLSMIEKIALFKAEKNNRLYHIILMNPDAQGNFNEEEGSTYEIVTDNFLNEEENTFTINYVAITDTDELKNRNT